MMTFLKTLLVSVMVVAFLPWGAFTAKFATSVQSGIAGFETSVEQDTPTTDATLLVSGMKRCKGPALPGSPCGPIVILFSRVDIPDVAPVVSQILFAFSVVRLRGEDHETLLDPPILA